MTDPTDTDPGAAARRAIVERHALRDADGAVMICFQATRCGKYKVAYSDGEHADAAAEELTPLVDRPLTGHECPNGDHWHITTEWRRAQSRPFSRYDRVVAALLAAPDGVLSLAQARRAGKWRNKYAGAQVKRILESLQGGGYIARTEDTVTVVDHAGLLDAHLRKHPNGEPTHAEP